MENEKDTAFHSGKDEPERRTPHRARKNAPELHFIGKWVRAARLAAGLTQQELAGQQFSKSYISALELGTLIPSFRALHILAARLGVPVSALLGESELDLSTLAARRNMRNILSEIERAEREETIRSTFGKVEGLLLQAKPVEALELLGGGNKPPDDWTAPQRMQWYWLASWASGFMGRVPQALRCAEQGVYLAEQLLAQAPLSEKPLYEEWVERLWCFWGNAHCADGQPGLAMYYHRQCLAGIGAGVVTDPYLKLTIYKGLGHDALALGWYSDAISYYRQADKQARDLQAAREQGLINWGLGLAYRFSGDLFRARMSYLQALEAFKTLGNLSMVVQVQNLLGNTLVDLQEYLEAEDHLRQGLQGAKSLQDVRTCGITLNNLATLSLAKQEVEESISLAYEGLSLAQQSKDQRAESELRLTLAKAYQFMDEGDPAEQAFQAAIQMAHHSQSFDVLYHAHESYGKFLYARGRYMEAYQQMELVNPLATRHP